MLLSLIIFLPAAGALVLCFMPKGQEEAIEAVLAGHHGRRLPADRVDRHARRGKATRPASTWARPACSTSFASPWIPSFDIHYFLGIDGISFPLVLLTSFLSMLAMGASWPITKHVKAYCILFLLLETGMLGVFMALDFFLFYVFWEVMLLPMYFLIGVWGGPRREYAAIKFFLFTLVGSVLMLIAMLMLYFASDLRQLDAEQLADGARRPGDRDEVAARQVRDGRGSHEPVHTFNILALAKIGQLAESPFNADAAVGQVARLVGLPAAVHRLRHQGAGGAGAHLAARRPRRGPHADLDDPGRRAAEDGRLRHPPHLLPDLPGGRLRPGLARLRRRRGEHGLRGLRRPGPEGLQAAGGLQLGEPHGLRAPGHRRVERRGRQPVYDSDYWKMGVNGAMFQMIAHGISSAGMFFLVGVIYDRVHHRDLDQFGGLFQRMPVYGGISIGIFFAALGLPGLCGFIGEVFVVLSAWNYSMVLAVVAASVVILTAGYILWTIQRVYLGPEYKGPHAEALTPMSRREIAIAAPLVALAILLGVYPRALLDYMTPTINKTVDDLAEWTQRDGAEAIGVETDCQPVLTAGRRSRNPADPDKVPQP